MTDQIVIWVSSNSVSAVTESNPIVHVRTKSVFDRRMLRDPKSLTLYLDLKRMGAAGSQVLFPYGVRRSDWRETRIYTRDF